MKMGAPIVVLLALAAVAQGNAVEKSPIAKIITMISDLETKVIAEGEAAQKEYAEFSEWCEDQNKNLAFEIKTGKSNSADLAATIEKEGSNIDAQSTKIGELAGAIAASEGDLKAATDIRTSERADFVAEEKELKTVINMLERAISVLEKELGSTAGAALLQSNNKMASVAQALNAMVSAAALSGADASKLTALVQSNSEDSDSDEELGAPAAAVYEGKGGGIVATCEGILDKANGQLATAQKKEETALQNFALLKQSLTDEIKYASKDKAAAADSKATSEEVKATSEGDLAVTTKDLAEDTKTMSGLHNECMVGAQDFEAATKGRGEELTALATAKKIIQEATANLASSSFVQVSSSLSTAADLSNYEAVRFVRDLARKQKAPLLAQLASRMNSAVKLGGAESDVFAKVKGLITDMIATLQKEAEEDATQKAFCDKEMSETTAKKEDKTAEVAKLTTKIDQASAKSAKLKEQTAALQKELAQLAASQAEMDKLRAEEKATFDVASRDLTQGLDGVKLALKVLKDFYSKGAGAGGSATGIVSLLEVCESDMSKDLAEITTIESTAASAYTTQSKENQVAKTMKDQDVKYKVKESVSLDKSANELSGDRTGVQAELDAVLEYDAKIKEQCVAKATPYAETKARRESEIAGLKEALEILEGEAALIQKSSRKLRGIKPAGSGQPESSKSAACSECASKKDHLEDCSCHVSDIMGTFANDATKKSTASVGHSKVTSNTGDARLPEGWMWHCRPVSSTGVWEQC